MVKPKNAFIALVVIIVCSGAFFMLLANTTIPIFSVKELMDNPNIDSFIDRRIQLVGVVGQENATGFFISDPDDTINATLVIFIEAIEIEFPTGFVPGKTVLIEGKLTSIVGTWYFEASMISTKCPSKYES